MNAAWLGAWAHVSTLGVVRPADTLPEVGAAEWARRYPHAAVDPSFDFDTLSGLGADPAARQMDALTRYVVACARLLPPPRAKAEHTGVIMGTGFGCTASNHQLLETLVARGPRRVAPVVFRNTVSNAFVGHLALLIPARGSSAVLNSGMVAGLQACAYAFEEVRHGRCMQILTGSGDQCSPVVQRRFLLQEQQYGCGPLPLLDGACAAWLTAEPAPAPACWRVCGYAMGVLDRHHPVAGLARLLSAASAHAGLDWSLVDALQLHTTRSVYWERTGGPAEPQAIAADLLSHAGAPPFQENSALVMTLALAASLQTLPAGCWPTLFTGGPPAPRLRQVPHWFLFAGVGSDGNSVVLVLECAPDPGR